MIDAESRMPPRSGRESPATAKEVGGMELDTNKIDDVTLALLYLGLHDEFRAWKGFDWDTMDRLHEAGHISDPRGRAKSVVFTETGLERARELLESLFAKPVAG
jgi:hypothetical protein